MLPSISKTGTNVAIWGPEAMGEPTYGRKCEMKYGDMKRKK